MRTFHVPASVTRTEVFDGIVRFLARLPVTNAWDVEIREYKRRRSDQQNRYLWGICYATILKAGNLQGWTADDLHEYFLGECFGWETVEGFGKKRIRPVRRSSKLNKQEFSDYVAFIQQRAADLGIVIEDPNA